MSRSTNHRSRLRRGAAAAGALAAAAVCGSMLALASASGSTVRGAGHVLTSGSVKGYGVVLGNSAGRSLYVLTDKDKVVACTSKSCVANWPPLVVAKGTKITAGSGVKGTIGTVARGAKEQVTYNGWPVYTFIGDSGAHQSNGEGIVSFGGTWYLVKASATSHDSTPVRAKASSPTGGGW